VKVRGTKQQKKEEPNTVWFHLLTKEEDFTFHTFSHTTTKSTMCDLTSKNNHKYMIWISISIALLVAIHSCEGIRQTFGEFCDSYYKCDFTRWLSCKNKKCACFNETETYFDEIEDRCVGLSGTNCSQMFFPFDEPDLLVIFKRKGKTSNHWRWVIKQYEIPSAELFIIQFHSS